MKFGKHSVVIGSVVGTAAFLLCLGGAAFHLKKKILSDPSFSSLQIVDRNGVVLRTQLSSRKGTSVWLELEQISPEMIHATLAAEDRRFYHHWGVDPIALMRAIFQNVKHRRLGEGASTLTQQLIRVVAQHPRTLRMKILESIEAVLLESVASKKTILTHYLNRVPYGNQTFGIGAAAQLYFGKPATHLSLAEAAFLAGLPQSPTVFNPYRHFDKALVRKDQVLRRLLITKSETPENIRLAFAQSIQLSPMTKDFLAPHYCDWILKELPPENQSASVIHTSLDWALQKDVEALTKTYIAHMKREKVTNAAVVVLDNRTGDVLSMVGSADYFNVPFDGQVNGALSPRPPGSTWKPFVYALALEKGIPASHVIADVDLHAPTQSGDFVPRNFDERFHGPVRFREALACSYNIPAVRMELEVGQAVLYQRLQQLGFSYLDKPASYYGLGLVLGGAECQLLQLVKAYSCFAKGGFLKANTGTPLFSEDVCALITDILSDSNARTAAFGSHSPLTFSFPVAAKTGTSKNFRDSWTVGYTRDHTIGVWVGNFDGSPMKSVSGSIGAAPLFHSIVTRLYQQHDPTPFPERMTLKLLDVCSRSGLRPTKDCSTVIQEKFIAGTEPQTFCLVHRRVALDTRNGLLATEDCRPDVVRTEVFEVYDSLYRLWTEDNNLPEVPRDISPLCAADQQNLIQPHAPPLQEASRTEKISILNPHSGELFMLDPILRREYQTIVLQPKVGSMVEEVEWWVEGKIFSRVSYPFTAQWPLSAGPHKIYFRARTGQSWQTSPVVKIQVL